MYYGREHDAYRKSAIETSSPEGLILMLYDGAITALASAEAALAEGRAEDYRNQMYKAQNIVSELMSSLDFARGGDVARNLFRLYEYFNYRMIQANVKGDASMIAEVKSSLTEIRSAWREAMSTLKDDGMEPTEARVAQ